MGEQRIDELVNVSTERHYRLSHSGILVCLERKNFNEIREQS